MESIRRATARFYVGGAEAGSAELVLVQRSGGGGFHADCDAESADLQFVGVALCDDRGTVRPASVRAADAADEASEGGFLYIDTFRCAAASAPAAIRALLCGLPELAGKWTLGAYVGDGRRGDSAAARDAAAEEDVRPFLRAGCAQVVELVGHGRAPVVFALPGALAAAPLLPASAEVKVAAAPPRKVKSAGSERLFQAMMAQGGPGLSAAFLAGARKLIEKEGASLAEACVLHVAVANGTTPAEVDALLALAPGEAERAAALTAADSDGLTVLMVAAASSPAKCKFGETVPTALCAHLLARGARKEAKDAKGLTAHGHALAAVQDIKDMCKAFGMPAGAIDAKALMQLLRVK